MKLVNSDLIVLPKVSSVSDEFNSSQLKVVYMEDYQIEETAFFPVYIWTTSVSSTKLIHLSHAKNQVTGNTCPTMPTIKETYGGNRYLFISKAYLQSLPCKICWANLIFPLKKNDQMNINGNIKYQPSALRKYNYLPSVIIILIWKYTGNNFHHFIYWQIHSQ